MKCYRGFLTIKDEVTRKEHPFFVKTREEDLIVKQVPLDWKQTSTMYDKNVHEEASEPEIYIGKDFTSYLFKTHIDVRRNEAVTSTGKYEDGEIVYHLYTDGTIVYKLFKDKSYEICGNMELLKSGSIQSIILPYECVGKITSANFFEIVDGYNNPLNVNMGKTQISNNNLKDGKNHLYKINVKNCVTADYNFVSIAFSIKGINV